MHCVQSRFTTIDRPDTLQDLLKDHTDSDYAMSTRSLRLNGHSTSVRLENLFWSVLDDAAKSRGITTPAFMSDLHADVLETLGEPANFTSYLRCVGLLILKGMDKAQPAPPLHTPSGKSRLPNTPAYASAHLR